MAKFALPQNDDVQKRKSELAEQAKPYKYNYDMKIPLIEAEGPDDKNKPDYQLKIITKLLTLRTNLQAISDKSGLQFQKPKPVRDINVFMEALKPGGNLVSYFTPDLGFIMGDKQARRPKSINDYVEKIFMARDAQNQGPAPVPEIASKWDSDRTFAYMFVGGPNPNQLVRYTQASRPQDFDLSKVALGSQPNFSGDSIEKAMGEGRLYFVDHSKLRQLFANSPGAPAPNATTRSFEGITSDDWKFIFAPYAAFAVPPGGKHLLPVAIQCGPSAEGHQIYTPKDGYSWKMAKACVLASHNNHHEVITHLGLTHLLVDPIVMATRIRLHNKHPIYRLLSPHFEGTVSINVGARAFLFLPERSIDRLIGSKIELNYTFLRKERLAYSFRDNAPPKVFERQGIADRTKLPNFPYREDALLIWDAVHSWISDYVSIWYQSDADIRADFELQGWANEIQNVGEVNDFCLSGGGVQGRDDLIDMLTMIIFTAGPQHAAVNFSQMTDMTFVPANPMGAYAPAPRGTGHSEQDYLNMLPPLDVAVHTWAILNLLAGVNNTRLGDYRGAFTLNPVSEAARIKFWAKLQGIEQKINAENKRRRSIYDLDYVHLLPSRIPASVNI